MNRKFIAPLLSLLIITSCTPTEPDTTHLEKGKQLQREKKYTEALNQFKQVIAQDVDSFEAYRAIAQIFYEQNQLEASVQFFHQALRTCPKNKHDQLMLANDLLQLGIKFFEQKKGEQAVAIFKTILQINEKIAAVHHNLAFTLAERLGRHEEAMKHYRRALELNPDDPETRFCFSLSCLATGNLDEGWEQYKARWKGVRNSPRTFVKTFDKLWEGQELKNKTILIRAEQGLGDTLHFIRYAQLLKKQEAFVIAEVQKPLINLLSLCPYIDKVVAIGQNLPPFDYQIPLLNTPAVCKTNLDTIPADIPYLYADKQIEKTWKKKITGKNFKVGLCWFGDAVHGQTKFMPLADFVPLMRMEGVSFYSLQKYSGLEQIADLPDDVTLHLFEDDFDKTNGGFMDTAAVMKHLDLVITADTSVAHLAGGLGVPVWIVLPFPAEWRWLTEKENSPWYPTARLFRKKTSENWSLAKQELLAALQEQLAA